MAIVNNIVLYTSKFKRIDLMLNVVITETKGHKETLEGGEYVFYLNCGDGIMGVCICTNSSNYTH